MAAGLMVTATNAQENASIVFGHQRAMHAPSPQPIHYKSKHNNNNNFAKLTNVTDSGWFSYFDAQSLANSDEYLWSIYPDSSAFTVIQGQNDSNFVFGYGSSIDPQSNLFYSGVANTDYTVTNFQIGSGTPYLVDSVQIIGKYERVKNSVDTFIH